MQDQRNSLLRHFIGQLMVLDKVFPGFIDELMRSILKKRV